MRIIFGDLNIPESDCQTNTGVQFYWNVSLFQMLSKPCKSQQRTSVCLWSLVIIHVTDSYTDFHWFAL